MIFSIRDLSFELGSLLLEGWLALAARAVCALLILLAAWLVRRWLNKKGHSGAACPQLVFYRHAHPAAQFFHPHPAHVQRHWCVSGRRFPAMGHFRHSKAAAALFPSRHDPSGLRRAVCRIQSGRPAAGFLQPGDPLQQNAALSAGYHLQGAGHRAVRGCAGAGGGLSHRQHRSRCRTCRPDHFAGCAGKRQQPVFRHRHPAG